MQYKCYKPCIKYRVGCSQEIESHMCPKKCFEECLPCELSVKKARTICPHVFNVHCAVDVDSLRCEKPCKKIMPCEHKCVNKCYQPCGPCEQNVSKGIPCGRRL